LCGQNDAPLFRNKREFYRKVKISDGKEPEHTVQENIIRDIEQQLALQVVARLGFELREQVSLIVICDKDDGGHDLEKEVARALGHQVVLRGQVEL